MTWKIKPWAVSYTHLDVYKRQARAFAKPDAAAFRIRGKRYKRIVLAAGVFFQRVHLFSISFSQNRQKRMVR